MSYAGSWSAVACSTAYRSGGTGATRHPRRSAAPGVPGQSRPVRLASEARTRQPLPKQSAAAYSPVWVVSLITLPSTVIEHLTGPVVAAARALGIEDHRRLLDVGLTPQRPRRLPSPRTAWHHMTHKPTCRHLAEPLTGTWPSSPPGDNHRIGATCVGTSSPPVGAPSRSAAPARPRSPPPRGSPSSTSSRRTRDRGQLECQRPSQARGQTWTSSRPGVRPALPPAWEVAPESGR